MNAPETIRRWVPVVKAWLAVGVFGIGVFSAGWTMGVITQQVRIDEAHRATLAAKDELIARLATATATASVAASEATDRSVQATNAAQAASGTAVQAADAAKEVADKIDKHTADQKKQLKRLQ